MINFEPFQFTIVQDNVEFKSRDGIAWVKNDKLWRRKNFTYYKCRCGRLVSNAGFAYHRHKKFCSAEDKNKKS